MGRSGAHSYIYNTHEKHTVHITYDPVLITSTEQINAIKMKVTKGAIHNHSKISK